MYQTPPDFYYRLHHPRPRFKNDIENVLGYMAFSIAELDGQSEQDFNENISQAIRCFGDNQNKADKTIQNWRTEISALFSMMQVKNGVVNATDLTKELADSSNLRAFFLKIIITFQYPGGFLKSHEIKKMTEAGISYFQPFLWLANFFTSRISLDEQFITDAEFCHCVLNDLRVTSKGESVLLTIDRIVENRRADVSYDIAGDTKRYALDLLDYCVLAGILSKDYNGKYFLKAESLPFLKFFQTNFMYFKGYQKCETLTEIEQMKVEWISYVNDASEIILSRFKIESDSRLHDKDVDDLIVQINTKEIGDQGEALAVAHEKIWLNNNDRVDLSKLVQHMPTQFAVGFDILSRELDATMKHIEVKTTVSQKSFTVHRVHLTPNEWLAAESHRERYFIYRLQLSEEEKTLWIIRDPVGLYKADRLKMSPRNGADLTFDKTCYEEVDLLRYYE